MCPNLSRKLDHVELLSGAKKKQRSDCVNLMNKWLQTVTSDTREM